LNASIALKNQQISKQFEIAQFESKVRRKLCTKIQQISKQFEIAQFESKVRRKLCTKIQQFQNSLKSLNLNQK
jgi:hypothetical protein